MWTFNDIAPPTKPVRQVGINFGALGGPLICAYLGETIDWHLGFAAAGVGMTFGLLLYLIGGRWLGAAGLHSSRPETPEAASALRRQLFTGIGVGLIAVVIIAALFASGVIGRDPESISNAFGIFLLALVVIFFSWLFVTGDWSQKERGRLWAIVALFLAASFFWAAYEQAGSSLNLFAERSTDRTHS